MAWSHTRTYTVQSVTAHTMPLDHVNTDTQTRFEHGHAAQTSRCGCNHDNVSFGAVRARLIRVKARGLALHQRALQRTPQLFYIELVPLACFL